MYFHGFSSLLFTLKEKPRYPCTNIFYPTVHPLHLQIAFIYNVIYLLPTLLWTCNFFQCQTFLCDYKRGLETLFLGYFSKCTYIMLRLSSLCFLCLFGQKANSVHLVCASLAKTGRTTYGEIGPVANQIYEIWIVQCSD